MSDGMWIEWTTPITVLASAVRAYGQRLMTAIERLCTVVAARIQSDAMNRAPWTDRTTHARAGLTARLMREGNLFIIVLVHSMYYGVYLELANGGRYAIILKTLQAWYPRLMRMIQGGLA